MLEIETLGGLRIGVDGKPLESMGSHKAEAILVYLAVEDRQVSRNFLEALFWPESSAEQAHIALRVTLSLLRKHLGEYLDISRQAVSLKNGCVYIDLAELESNLACCRIEQALDLYKGEFLQGFLVQDCPEFEDWMLLEGERARKSLASALHAAAQSAMAHRGYATGLSYASRLLELDPLDERAHQLCMLALALDNCRGAALAQYEACQDILQQELGAPPSQETQELYERILSGEDLTHLAPTPPPHNLPAPQTSFIGRTSELAKISQLLQNPSSRLVTLVGPGGSGKTRLAVEAARAALSLFPHGVYFAHLESAPSTDHLVGAIASALGFDIDSSMSQLDPRTQLIDHLGERTLLLVLDGCESRLAGTGLLAQMLARAPNLQVLATSREVLDLSGEWTLPVGGLPFSPEQPNPPGDEPEALALFIERARQANPQVELSSANREDALHICRLVEGMPLGIELAAAWTNVLSPGDIASEMEKSLDFLAASARDLPQKHRSLRAAFEGTWARLSDPQRAAFSRLSVFQGGFERQAAEGVAEVSLAELSELLDKSLLRRDAHGRFRIHALLQQFAAEKLAQSAEETREVRDRHCSYYTSLLDQRRADFMGPSMLQARQEIRAEMENVRAAVLWTSLNRAAGAVRETLLSLLCFYSVHGWHAGITAMQEIAQLRRDALLESEDPSRDPILLSAQVHQAFLHCNLGQVEQSETLSRAALGPLVELGWQAELSECLHNLGVNASFSGEYERARELLEEAIRLGRECNHILWPTYLLWLGHVHFLLGEYEDGLLSLTKCREIFERQGCLWGCAFALGKMGLAADGLREHIQAMEYHRQALGIFERSGDQAGQGYSLSRMSMSAALLGEYLQARRYGEQGLRILEEIGHRWGISTSLCRLGFAALGLGEQVEAREYFLDALQHSSDEKMLPLSLYALAGLACVLAQAGDRSSANELYWYVKRHPRTPAAYLMQASSWMSDADLDYSTKEDSPSGKLQPVEQIVARYFG